MEVIERVGAVQLAKQGVGDVATAVTKATGTLKQEGSGQIFVRGLGDRYNGTTMNGLEIPSEDPEFKNINLEIYKTSMIEYVSLDKVYNPRFSGDFGGANIDIVSKTHVGKPYFVVGMEVLSIFRLLIKEISNFRMEDLVFLVSKKQLIKKAIRAVSILSLQNGILQTPKTLSTQA